MASSSLSSLHHGIKVKIAMIAPKEQRNVPPRQFQDAIAVGEVRRALRRDFMMARLVKRFAQ
jgi:hypothetical protein